MWAHGKLFVVLFTKRCNTQFARKSGGRQKSILQYNLSFCRDCDILSSVGVWQIYTGMESSNILINPFQSPSQTATPVQCQKPFNAGNLKEFSPNVDQLQSFTGDLSRGVFSSPPLLLVISHSPICRPLTL